VLTRQAVKDAEKLEQAGLKPKTVLLLQIIGQNPFQNPPPYEKLKGYEGTYSRRINIQQPPCVPSFIRPGNYQSYPYVDAL
jgi:Txe/YoeB family toxin of Txe-Axe toxin-antitoxin module